MSDTKMESENGKNQDNLKYFYISELCGAGFPVEKARIIEGMIHD